MGEKSATVTEIVTDAAEELAEDTTATLYGYQDSNGSTYMVAGAAVALLGAGAYWYSKQKVMKDEYYSPLLA